jgi:hypothetical protein
VVAVVAAQRERQTRGDKRDEEVDREHTRARHRRHLEVPHVGVVALTRDRPRCHHARPLVVARLQVADERAARAVVEPIDERVVIAVDRVGRGEQEPEGSADRSACTDLLLELHAQRCCRLTQRDLRVVERGPVAAPARRERGDVVTLPPDPTEGRRHPRAPVAQLGGSALHRRRHIFECFDVSSELHRSPFRPDPDWLPFM